MKLLWTFAGACALAGCSLLINPDEARLSQTLDASATTDAGFIDGGDECEETCDDDVECTEDRCEAGNCSNVPVDSRCGEEERCSPILGCVPYRCTRDVECDNGLYCDGQESCDEDATEGTGCVDGEAITCDDDASCTSDSCDEADDRCVFSPDDSACAGAVECVVGTCNPDNSEESSGCVTGPDDAVCDEVSWCQVGQTCDTIAGCIGGEARDCSDGSVCTIDSCDADIRECVNALRDNDGDGFHPRTVRDGGSTVECGGMDCDDDDDTRRPGVAELCNEVDDDCDTAVDEDCVVPDDCGSAIEISLNPAGRGRIGGDYEDLDDDLDPECGSAGGRDAVYFVDLREGLYDVEIDTVGSEADTVLAAGLTCSNLEFRQACNDDIGSGPRTSRVWLHRVRASAAGTRIYILLDAYSDLSDGEYRLNVQVRPAAEDSCGATPIDLTGGGTLRGFTSPGGGEEEGACIPSGEPDRPEGIATFDHDGGLMTLEVFSPSSTYAYLRESPCDSGDELECDQSVLEDGQWTIEFEPSPPASRYYLFVEGSGSYTARYDP